MRPCRQRGHTHVNAAFRSAVRKQDGLTRQLGRLGGCPACWGGDPARPSVLWTRS